MLYEDRRRKNECYMEVGERMNVTMEAGRERMNVI